MGLNDILKGMSNISKIKLHSGLVGWICAALIAMCVSITVICLRMDSIMLTLTIMGMVFAMILVITLRLIALAGKIPHAVLDMEFTDNDIPQSGKGDEAAAVPRSKQKQNDPGTKTGAYGIFSKQGNDADRCVDVIRNPGYQGRKT
jgi:hypothetical protein